MFKATAKLEDFYHGNECLSQIIDVKVTADMECPEVWDWECRTTGYGDPQVASTPVFSVDLHILSPEANAIYADYLATMYGANQAFRDYVNRELRDEADRMLEDASLEHALAARGEW